MLNIYQLHSKPDQLKGYDQAYEKVPEFIWEKYKKQPKQLKKHENALAKDPIVSYRYAVLILQNRFPEGEDAIAQSPLYSYFYATNVLNDRFLKGENAIKQDQKLWNMYKYQHGIDDD